VAVFSARPGRIKQIISVNEQHPRNRSFMASQKISQLRNELYELLHDEIRRTMDQPKLDPGSPSSSTFTVNEGGKT
jgi:NitT/TauT family transport system ATP-binding protein